MTHVDWTQVGSYQLWTGIAMSSNGQYQSAVVVNGGYIWQSSNYGAGDLTVTKLIDNKQLL